MDADPLEASPLWFLVGPTASGKSDFALELAPALGAEIASLDSMQVYRGMDLGTAKPDAAARARVRHHLLDLVAPGEAYSVARYVEDARAALAEIRGRGRRALFVGGTALYLKALTHGLFRGPDAEPELRARLERRWEAEGGARLFAELAQVDAASARRLHPHDRKRVLRALEVHAQTGRPLSDWQREWRDGAGAAAGRARRIVGLEGPDLERRIRLRTRALLDAGWVDEVRRVREQGGFGRTAAQALGYADVLAYADGRITREECEARVDLRTRQFARRQRTWLRQFPEIRWIAPREPGALQAALRHFRS